MLSSTLSSIVLFVSALTAVSGTPAYDGRALYARQLARQSLADTALHRIYACELYRRVPIVGQPQGDTPPASPWDKTAPDSYKHQKAQGIYEHGEKRLENLGKDKAVRDCFDALALPCFIEGSFGALSIRLSPN